MNSVTDRPKSTGDSLELLETIPGRSADSISMYGTTLAPGALVGRWIVETMAARGGFGNVYRARDTTSDRSAAVKVLHAYMARSPNIVKRFQLEAETVNRIRHENIVELYELGALTDGRPFMAMEWLDGVTLEGRLRERGTIDPAAIVTIMEGLCAALAAAHAAGVVHRDLKASNVILVARDGRELVKLVDFGIAKLLDDAEARLTATGAVVGTPSYMAPEQILGRTIGPATDIYALGVLLFHLLTGKLPFQADTAFGVEQQHLHAAPPRPSEARSGISEALDDVILRCLEKDPQHRHPNIAAFLDDLRDAHDSPHRPSQRFTTTEDRGLALHLSGRALDDPAALPLVRDELDRAGLAIVSEGDGMILAAAPLPRAIDAARRLRLAAVECARALHQTHGVAASLALGQIKVLRVEGATQVVGGELLANTQSWSGSAGISASADVVADLGDDARGVIVR
jgi:serine/threonine-protein kinase